MGKVLIFFTSLIAVLELFAIEGGYPLRDLSARFLKISISGTECSGTRFGDKILTAAHCVRGLDQKRIPIAIQAPVQTLLQGMVSIHPQACKSELKTLNDCHQHDIAVIDTNIKIDPSQQFFKISCRQDLVGPSSHLGFGSNAQLALGLAKYRYTQQGSKAFLRYNADPNKIDFYQSTIESKDSGGPIIDLFSYSSADYFIEQLDLDPRRFLLMSPNFPVDNIRLAGVNSLSTSKDGKIIALGISLYRNLDFIWKHLSEYADSSCRPL